MRTGSTLWLGCFLFTAGALEAQAGPRQGPAAVLDLRALLDRQLWRDNRDTDWFAARIPAFESPDSAIDATYYYRWELVTKHLTYGSPETGYTLTEFIDRPFWSGAYGAISCPLGHQMEEIRWLDDRGIIEDFARYWLETPGAEPRSYSNWYGAAVWGTYEVLADTAFLRRMLPLMKRQYAGWVAEHWDPAHRMFRWDGLHDGMERNINSRQTDDIDAGAEGYRPTLNSYLYADARAIARASLLFGDTATARDFAARADSLRRRVQDELWDERRTFFLHQFARDEKGGVRALTRTYDSGRWAGDPHGRELIGYVPWQFDLPEPNRGYERAWRFLMDSAHFHAPFGPTTAERHDPQFHISSQCCWWSGNSWPYATTQTLVAMANLLNHYRQSEVTARDWMALFSIYTRTHRKDGRPYVAEAANPDNGSWEGHDTPYHSEHYFHSGYVNLVVTGLAGLRPRADDSVEVNPLAPAAWPWFALDGVRYHGRRLSILWDRLGTRYGRGRGLIVLADGREIARAPELGRLVAHLGPPRSEPPPAREINLAVNNGRGAYPWIEASFAAPLHPPAYLVDGHYWYHTAPPNRWTTTGSPNTRDTVTLDFGVERRIHRVALYLLDDGAEGAVRAPARYVVEAWQSGRWAKLASERRDPVEPAGRRANHLSFAPLQTERVRIVFTPRSGAPVGLAEMEVWGPAAFPLAGPTAGSPDLAFNPGGSGFPQASASYTHPSDRVEQVNDLRFGFTRYSRNRWSAYQSPNAVDWVEIDFGAPKTVRSIELYLYGNGRGVAAPRDYSVELWDGRAWKTAQVRSRAPVRPLASARNVVTIEPAEASRIRVRLEHDLPAFSGITELIVR
ncbi:MAG TPA: discoidin domain-containing protein [Gemmatimonadales bacterium]|nr:discoidin domain-containing protein [Gemmatimonadales bacterium]